MYLDLTLQKIREGTRRAKEGSSHGKRQVQAVLDAATSEPLYSTATAILNEVSYSFHDGLWTPSTQSIWQAPTVQSSTTNNLEEVVVSTSTSTSDKPEWQVQATAFATMVSSADDTIQSTSISALLSTATDEMPIESITSSMTMHLASSPSTASSSASRDETWITSTTAIALPSGVTIVPFITFGKERPSTAVLPSSVAANVVATGTGASAFAGPTAVHNNESMHTTGKNTAGIVAGSIAGVVIIVIAAFVYLRGGSIHGFGFKPKDPKTDLLCTRKTSQEGPTWVSSRHQPGRSVEPSSESEKAGEIQCESAELHHKTGEWTKINVIHSDSRHGYMSLDDGEWLEDWRRRKELLMSRQGPPELKFDPGLPLPPISTRTLENWDLHS